MDFLLPFLKKYHVDKLRPADKRIDRRTDGEIVGCKDNTLSIKVDEG